MFNKHVRRKEDRSKEKAKQQKADGKAKVKSQSLSPVREMRGSGEVDGMQSIQEKDGVGEQSVPLPLGIGVRGNGPIGNRSRGVSTAAASTMTAAE